MSAQIIPISSFLQKRQTPEEMLAELRTSRDRDRRRQLMIQMLTPDAVQIEGWIV